MIRPIKFRIYARAWKPPRYIQLNELQLFGQKTVQDALDYVTTSNLFICQQFTGLVDRKGEEIYEGDIIQCFDDYPLSEVVFKHGMFGYAPYNEFEPLPLERFIVVKGNICETSYVKALLDLSRKKS